MIPLPPGCTVNYNIWLDVDTLTDEMVEWFEMIGGHVILSSWRDLRGKEHVLKFVKYGIAKPCHRYQDGSNRVKINFSGDDASVASMFLLKFMENIEKHNMKEYMNYD